MENNESNKTVRTKQELLEKHWNEPNVSIYDAMEEYAQSQTEEKDKTISYYREWCELFKKGKERLKSDNESIAKHNADLLKTIETQQKQIEKKEIQLSNHAYQTDLAIRDRDKAEAENERAKEFSKDAHEMAKLEGMIALYARLEASSERIKITLNGKWIELNDYMGGVRVALDCLKDRNKTPVDQVESKETVKEHDCTRYAKVNCKCPKGVCNYIKTDC